MKGLCSEFVPNESTDFNKIFPYPSCYNDEQRLHVLMSPFRDRHVNPESYDCKMKFWQDLIAVYCEFKGEPMFNKRDLQHVLSKGMHTLYALDTVLNEMICVKKVRFLMEYMYNPNDSWRGWIINSFIRKPLAWSVHKFKCKFRQFSETDADVQHFVHLNVLDTFCKQLELKILQQHQGQLISYKDFKDLTNSSLCFSEDGLKLCIYTLHQRNKIGLKYSLNDELYIHFIKIPTRSDGSLSITETDLALYNLKVCQEKLLQQINDLETEVKQNENKVLEYVSQKKRRLAEPYIRKKHFLENKCQKRFFALHNIETLLHNISEAKTNGEILDAYKCGSKALQTTLSESGLRFDKIDDIISEVRDTIENHEDLQETLSNLKLSDSTMGEPIDDCELEVELNNILKSNAMLETEIKNEKASKIVSKDNISDNDVFALLEDLDIEVKSPKNITNKQRVLVTNNNID